jgi:hypothetical protein
MIKFIAKHYAVILFSIAVFALTCVTASASKVVRGNCGNEYQIDYIVATNLFCELGGKND